MTVLGSCFWCDIENFIWLSAPNRLVVIIPGHIWTLPALQGRFF
jgi:hypothetical protein